MKLRIERLIRRQKEGKRGPYTSLSIKSGDRWYNAFEGEWNRAWREGDEVDVPGVKERQYQDRNGNTQTAYDIPSPPRAGGNADMAKQITELIVLVREIKLILTEGRVGCESSDDAPPPSDDDMPPDGEPIPF